MSGRVNTLLVATLVASAVFVAPTVAYASCGGGPSAQHVYSECVPGGNGSKSTSGPSTGGKGGSTPVPNRTATAIGKTGKDRRILSAFISGAKRPLPSPGSGSESGGPGILGAFDLGSGPLTLLAVLVGTAALLAVSGVRGGRWRRN